MLAPARCVYCSGRAEPGSSLCLPCLEAIDERHIDNNQVVVEAWIDYCLTRFAQLLAAYRLFREWERNHPAPSV